jgi:hypothetical protein
MTDIAPGVYTGPNSPVADRVNSNTSIPKPGIVKDSEPVSVILHLHSLSPSLNVILLSHQFSKWPLSNRIPQRNVFTYFFFPISEFTVELEGSTPTSYLGITRFKFQPDDRLSRGSSWFSSVLPAKFQDSTSN